MSMASWLVASLSATTASRRPAVPGDRHDVATFAARQVEADHQDVGVALGDLAQGGLGVLRLGDERARPR